MAPDWDLGGIVYKLNAMLDEALDDALEEAEPNLDELSTEELLREAFSGFDYPEEVAAAYHRGEFDLEKVARAIGVEEFKRVANRL